MLRTLYRYHARRPDDDTEIGFTLIELLIVIVVLGILAAVTVFALSGVTSTSAQSACSSDAATVNTALAAYNAQSPTVPATGGATGNLVTGTPSYLQAWPTSTHYTITIATAAVPLATNPINPIAIGQVAVLGNVASVTIQGWAPGSANTACSSTYVK